MKKALWEQKRVWIALVFIILCSRLQSNLLRAALELVPSSTTPVLPDMTVPPIIDVTPATFTTENRTLMTTLSGCNMSKWVYIHPIKIHNRNGFPTNRDDAPKPTVFAFREFDCQEVPQERRLTNMTLLSEGDTIYIPIKKLQGFIIHELPQVRVPVLIISGQSQLTKRPPAQQHLQTLLDHSMVIAWFCQNLDVYATNYTNHPKLHPWPYGLADTPYRHQYANREVYRQAVLEASSNSSAVSKHVILHLAFFSISTNKSVRRYVPNGVKSHSTADYLREMARAHFIFSPNGDRPECYRHYEAIGLGTAPITQLDPHVHRHLQGSVVYRRPDADDPWPWNVTYWNSSRATEDHHDVIPNRNLIFEDYWVTYAERQIGRSFQWVDTPSITGNP